LEEAGVRAGFTRKAFESFSDEKSYEEVITGILGWTLRASLDFLFGDNIFAPSLAILAWLLTAPLRVALTQFQLRNVGTRDRPAVALRFGIYPNSKFAGKPA
jgi:hypothetical protein